MTDTQETNSGQAAFWNGPAGRAWVAGQALIDQMLRPFEDLLVDIVAAGTGKRVLDIGCGPGTTTLAFARQLGAGGECVGLDISEPMIEAARAQAERESLPATFLLADAQTHGFEPAGFDLIVSRFGVMFFDDPVAAFANLRRAARPGATLHFIAWRSAGENPFMTLGPRAAAPFLPDMALPGPDGPGQFGFGDKALVQRILEESGWEAIDIRPIDVACTMPESELTGYMTRRGPVGLALREADDALRAKVVSAIRDAFAPYVKGDTVHFTAACWMVSAQAPATA